jgi:hypothetical protein
MATQSTVGDRKKKEDFQKISCSIPCPFIGKPLVLFLDIQI